MRKGRQKGAKKRSGHPISDRYDPLLPAYTERGEQYDTLCGQEDNHFLARLSSYNSLVVEVAGVEPASESTLTGLSPGADDHCGGLTPPVPITDGRPSRRRVR